MQIVIIAFVLIFPLFLGMIVLSMVTLKKSSKLDSIMVHLSLRDGLKVKSHFYE